MLSHDSGDIKNVENELITKKIQAFELRRFVQLSFSTSIIIFAAKLSLRDTTFPAVFLHDRYGLSPSRSFMKSRSSNKLSKTIDRLPIGLITTKIYTFELCRNLYNFDSFYSIRNILSVKNYIFK